MVEFNISQKGSPRWNWIIIEIASKLFLILPNLQEMVSFFKANFDPIEFRVAAGRFNHSLPSVWCPSPAESGSSSSYFPSSLLPSTRNHIIILNSHFPIPSSKLIKTNLINPLRVYSIFTLDLAKITFFILILYRHPCFSFLLNHPIKNDASWEMLFLVRASWFQSISPFLWLQFCKVFKRLQKSKII